MPHQERDWWFGLAALLSYRHLQKLGEASLIPIEGMPVFKAFVP